MIQLLKIGTKHIKAYFWASSNGHRINNIASLEPTKRISFPGTYTKDLKMQRKEKLPDQEILHTSALT